MILHFSMRVLMDFTSNMLSGQIASDARIASLRRMLHVFYFGFQLDYINLSSILIYRYFTKLLLSSLIYGILESLFYITDFIGVSLNRKTNNVFYQHLFNF